MSYWEPPMPEIEDALSAEELEERLNWLEFAWDAKGSDED